MLKKAQDAKNEEDTGELNVNSLKMRYDSTVQNKYPEESKRKPSS